MKPLEVWYLDQTNSGALTYDAYQLAILQQLDLFIINFNKSNLLSRLFNRPAILGIYLYGEVGRGKTLIINQLYQKITDKQKVRIHFHHFIQDIHTQLANLKNQPEPLNTIAKCLRKKYRIIFLDELHINDIATAMILKNLLDSLFDEGIYVVTTSNYMPKELYQDGLMRERFLPAIDLICNKLQVLSLDSNQDYRSLYHSSNQMFIIKDENSHSKILRLFNHIAYPEAVTNNDNIIISGRKIPYIKRSTNIIWFSFNTICGTNRSQPDYLELSQKFEYIIIEGITQIKSEDKDIARRFTSLIDIIYDERRKLIISSSCNLDQIYPGNDGAFEFERTVSRLIEMQTNEYLTKYSIGSTTL